MVSGRGSFLLDKSKTHDDLRMLQMSIKKRWDIPEDFRSVIIERLRYLIETGDDDELALKAIGQVRLLESQNQKDEHKDLDEFSNRVLQLANRLGIETGDGGISNATEGRASGGDGLPSQAND